LLVADTRALKGAQAENLDKLIILPNGVAFGVSGPKFILDKLIPVLSSKRPAEKTFDDFIERAETAANLLYSKYRARRGDEWEPSGRPEAANPAHQGPHSRQER
jgi:hypothetical protein